VMKLAHAGQPAEPSLLWLVWWLIVYMPRSRGARVRAQWFQRGVLPEHSEAVGRALQRVRELGEGGTHFSPVFFGRKCGGAFGFGGLFVCVRCPPAMVHAPSI
jgi:hypothetical protein